MLSELSDVGPLIGPMPSVNQLFAVVSSTSRSGPVYPVQPPGERICMVSVAIGPGRVFTGIGSTFAQAKANAAAQVSIFFCFSCSILSFLFLSVFFLLRTYVSQFNF